jgi:hypothetical protein
VDNFEDGPLSDIPQEVLIKLLETAVTILALETGKPSMEDAYEGACYKFARFFSDPYYYRFFTEGFRGAHLSINICADILQDVVKKHNLKLSSEPH